MNRAAGASATMLKVAECREHEARLALADVTRVRSMASLALLPFVVEVSSGALQLAKRADRVSQPAW